MSDYSKYYKKIGEIVKNEYFVGSYQRGYRWDKDNVVCFLDDIFEGKIPDKKTLSDKRENCDCQELIDYIKDICKKNDTLYCIQPIVVKKSKDGKYNVIDGQQRLTTIYIILQMLKHKVEEYCPNDENAWASCKMDLQSFMISYGSRVSSTNPKGDIYGLKNDSVVDREYIKCAYENAENWYKKKEDEIFGELTSSQYDKFSLIKIIIPIIRDKTVVIWDYTEENDGDNTKQDTDNIKQDTEQDRFKTCNTGKLDLTDAELIKAIFMNPMNYRKDENDKSDASDIQILISEIWDSYENRLHEEDFWKFVPIDNASKSKCENSSRMDIIFRIQAGCCKKNIWENKDHGLYWAIKEWMEEKLDDTNDNRSKKEKVLGCWRDICDLFDGLEELYKNNELYNLLYLYKKVQIDNNKDLSNLYEKYKVILEKNKTDRVEEAKKLVVESLFKNPGENTKESITRKVKETRYYDSGEKIRDILFAYNIALTDLDPSKNRFDFMRYEAKPESDNLKRVWDIEHIYSTNENEIGLDLTKYPRGKDEKGKLQARIDLLKCFKTEDSDDTDNHYREYLEYLYADSAETIDGVKKTISEQIDYYSNDLTKLFDKVKERYDQYFEIWRYLKFRELADYYTELFEKKLEIESLIEKYKNKNLSDDELNRFLEEKNAAGEYNIISFLRDKYFSSEDRLIIYILENEAPQSGNKNEWYGIDVFNSRLPVGIDMKKCPSDEEDKKIWINTEIKYFVTRCRDYYMTNILNRDPFGNNLSLEKNGGPRKVDTQNYADYTEKVMTFLEGTADRIERIINEFFSYVDNIDNVNNGADCDDENEKNDEGTKISPRDKNKETQQYYSRCWKFFMNDNTFGNMMLLDYRINRNPNYRNVCFDEKREYVFSPDKIQLKNKDERIFLPIGTQDVYNGRYLEKDFSGRWLMGERKRYIEGMIDTLIRYFDESDNGGTANV